MCLNLEFGFGVWLWLCVLRVRGQRRSNLGEGALNTKIGVTAPSQGFLCFCKHRPALFLPCFLSRCPVPLSGPVHIFTFLYSSLFEPSFGATVLVIKASCKILRPRACACLTILVFLSITASPFIFSRAGYGSRAISLREMDGQNGLTPHEIVASVRELHETESAKQFLNRNKPSETPWNFEFSPSYAWLGPKKRPTYATSSKP